MIATMEIMLLNGKSRNKKPASICWFKGLEFERFKCGEFAIIKSNAGLNGFKVSVKELIERANIISLIAKAGRYGGTYAHKKPLSRVVRYSVDN